MILHSFHQRYCAIVGSLNHLAVTRPDISHSMLLTSRYYANKTTKHIEAAQQKLRYLKGSFNTNIMYVKSRDLDVSVYVYSDCTRCIDTWRSMTHWVALINNVPMLWLERR
jgi:hypothetical protein